MMCETKLVLLGTGTPNAEPFASGPSSAVVVDGNAYLVDFGPGVVRQCTKAYEKGVSALHPKNLKVAFCTHLHTDHTAGYPDLLFTPWVLERETRKDPLARQGGSSPVSRLGTDLLKELFAFTKGSLSPQLRNALKKSRRIFARWK